MDFVGAGADTTKLKKMEGSTPMPCGKSELLHTCFGESSEEETEDDCSREKTVSDVVGDFKSA